MIIEETVYLEHYGVKGMRWGKRGTIRAQKRLDRLNRISTGTASTKDRLGVGLLTTKKGAGKALQRGANNQAKMNAGKLKVSRVLATVSGVKVKDLNFYKQGDPKAKSTSGERVVLAVAATILLANGAKQLSSLS